MARTVIVALPIFLLAFMSNVSAQTDRHGIEQSSMAESLRRLEDREAIRLLLINYGRHFDSRDFAAYSNLFARDGVWVGGGGDTEFVGPRAIREMVEEGFPPSFYPGSFHIMTSISVELTSADSATAWSRWTFLVRDDDGSPIPFRAGHYEDTLVREAGQWKFQRRQVFAE
jgi:uncharacterized protein (TIGR02246 family)